METAAEQIPEIQNFAGENGTCSEPRALTYLNRARRLLWNKTDYRGVMEWYRVCCINTCFTLPNIFEQIRVAFYGNTPLALGDEWYESIPQVGLLDPNCRCNIDRLIQSGDRHVTFRDYEEEPYWISLQAENVADVGVQLTIFSTDKYGTRKNQSLSLVAPPERVNGTILTRSIQAVVKPRTAGRVRLYAVNPNTGQYLLLAIYQPYDVNPTFKRYKLPKCCTSLTINAKKRYFDIVETSELVEFPLEAMIWAVQAVTAREAKNKDDYLANAELAVLELQKSTEDNEQPVAGQLRIFGPNIPVSLTPTYPGWGGGYYGDSYFYP